LAQHPSIVAANSTTVVLAAAAVIGLLVFSFISLLIFRVYDLMEEKYYARFSGAEALQQAGVALPGLSPNVSGAQRKVLPPSAQVASRKPAVLVNPKKDKDFWGLQSVPDIALSGVKTIDKVVKPGGALCVSVTKMHNAIFHISNNIKSYAAGRLGAPQIESPGMKHGLPMLDIFKTRATGERDLIATIDCKDGLSILSNVEWASLDNAAGRVPCTELIRSLADWLVFCRVALDTKDDMAVELLDDRTAIPLVKVADNDYVLAAPWVKTRIRYGGFLGFCRTEREIDLEELLQRVKVRTMSGRRANRRAAKAQLKTLATHEKETELLNEIDAKVASTMGLDGEARERAGQEISALQSTVTELRKLLKFAKRKLKALAKRGFLYQHRKQFSDLHWVRPSDYAQGDVLAQWEWVTPPINLCGSICYWCCWWPCKLQGWMCCLWCWVCYIVCTAPKPPKRTKPELRLVRAMKKEQKRRDDNIKQWAGYVTDAIAQTNQLLPMIQKSFINSTGYKLDLRSSICLVKTDLIEMCAMQNGGSAGDLARDVGVSVGTTALKEMMKSIRPNITLKTDFALLKEGKSPITELSVDFTFLGIGGRRR